MSYSSSSITTFPRSPPRTSTSVNPKRPTASITCLRIGAEEIAGLAHNKVLVAATVASAIGQLSKPLTSALNGNRIDVKAAVRSGGMPSTHSAGVVAAATSLGLERGFSDSVFGMSVVFAAFVMYDAQGVRREVGYHARILNRILNAKEVPLVYQEEDEPGTSVNSVNLAPLLSRSEKENSYKINSESYSSRRSAINLSRLGAKPSLKVDGEETSEKAYSSYKPLNESVGHTEIQVIVGALLGFIVSLTIDIIL